MKLVNAAIAAVILLATQQAWMHRKEVPSYARTEDRERVEKMGSDSASQSHAGRDKMSCVQGQRNESTMDLWTRVHLCALPAVQGGDGRSDHKEVSNYVRAENLEKLAEVGTDRTVQRGIARADPLAAQGVAVVVARKALRGDFGVIPKWQQDGYEYFAAGRGRRRMAWITYYWPGERGVDRITASGRPVSRRVAAMNGVPFGTWVLVSLPRGHQIRQVWDRGSRRNLLRARRRKVHTWVDLCEPRRTKGSHIREVWIAP